MAEAEAAAYRAAQQRDRSPPRIVSARGAGPSRRPVRDAPIIIGLGTVSTCWRVDLL